MTPGSKWRILTKDKRGDAKVELRNEGIFDELVIDHWFHLEQMSEREYWARIGDARIWVRIDQYDRAHVQIERGEYEPLDEEEEIRRRKIAFEIGQLRHLYAQMVNGHVTDPAMAARGILGPAIEALEQRLGQK